MSQPQRSPQKTGPASNESHATADCPAVLQNDFHQGFSYCFSGPKILARERSPFQEIVILETERFGKILNIDGYNNRAEADGHKTAIYYGWYSNRTRGFRKARGLLPPAPPGQPPAEADRAPLATRRTWARLIRKIYKADPLLCPLCGATI